MINCLLSFNHEIGIGDIFTLLTLLGGVYLYFRFNKKLNNQQTTLNEQVIGLNTQNKELNEQVIGLNTQNKELNEQAKELNTQNKELNEQLKQLNKLQLDEKIERKKADLHLSLVKVDTYDYNLIVDNRGEAVASNITVFSYGDNILDGPDGRSVVLETSLDPHDLRLVKTIHVDRDELDLSVNWSDSHDPNRDEPFKLKTKKALEYKIKLKHLYKDRIVPGCEDEINLSETFERVKLLNELMKNKEIKEAIFGKEKLSDDDVLSFLELQWPTENN